MSITQINLETQVKGTLPTSCIPNIDANKITTGVLNEQRQAVFNTAVKLDWNGTITTWVLPSVPRNTNGLILSKNGAVMIPGIDFNISGSTITMLTPPAMGSKTYAYWWK